MLEGWNTEGERRRETNRGVLNMINNPFEGLTTIYLYMKIPGTISVFRILLDV